MQEKSVTFSRSNEWLGRAFVSWPEGTNVQHMLSQWDNDIFKGSDFHSINDAVFEVYCLQLSQYGFKN